MKLLKGKIEMSISKLQHNNPWYLNIDFEEAEMFIFKKNSQSLSGHLN